MATESRQRPPSRSPPSWQRQSHPAPSPTTTSTPAQPLPSATTPALKSDPSMQPIQAPRYVDLAPGNNEKDALDAPSPSVSLTTASAPPTMYQQGPPAGPPPPYSSCYPASSLAASALQNGEPDRLSQPSSRRASREEASQDSVRLPSISEALNLSNLDPQSQQQAINVFPPPAPPPPPPPPPPFSAMAEPSRSVASASPTIPRSHIDSRQPSSLSSFSSQQSPHSAKPPDPVGQRPYASTLTESPRMAHYRPYSPQAPSPTDLHGSRMSPRMSGPPNPAPHQYSQTPLPAPPGSGYPPRPAYPSSTAPPPPAPSSQAPHPPHPPQPGHTQGPGYPGYPPSYPPASGFSFPPPQTSGLSYGQSLAFGSHQQWAQHAEYEKVAEQRRAAAAHPRASYGGSGYGLTVKRHLDDFDLENSLNEIAERTQSILAFSRTYGSEASRYARTTVPVSHLPAADKVAEMINQSLAITDALHRLKSTVHGMNVAAAEAQARQQQQSAMAKPSTYQPYDADHSGRPGYGMHSGQDHDGDKGELGSGGFAGPDAKKPRRGRNAPPGRCHSCNRAETPEWRRGPDGARTLCNACGLHYAKLTRKMGTKPGQPGGTNLRPKDGEDPAA